MTMVFQNTTQFKITATDAVSDLKLPQEPFNKVTISCRMW